MPELDRYPAFQKHLRRFRATTTLRREALRGACCNAAHHELSLTPAQLELAAETARMLAAHTGLTTDITQTGRTLGVPESDLLRMDGGCDSIFKTALDSARCFVERNEADQAFVHLVGWMSEGKQLVIPTEFAQFKEARVPVEFGSVGLEDMYVTQSGGLGFHVNPSSFSRPRCLHARNPCACTPRRRLAA